VSEIFYQFKNVAKKIFPEFLLNWYHYCLVFLGAIIYGFPGRRLKVIGITGTSGKSTVVALTTAILEEAGFRVASLSSIKFRIVGSEEINTKRMTLPGRFFVQRFLSRAVRSNCQYAVLEITSEGIVQHRHRFIGFEAVVFTNLSSEHIESHGSFEKYRQAKGQLFAAAKNIHIINLDDENAGYFSQFKAKERLGFSTKISNDQFPIIKAENIEILADGSKFAVNGLEFKLSMIGEFNVYNALAAIAVAQSQGISLEICQKALEKFSGVPGRMEQIIFEPFKVFVDYAITPNALQKVYETLSEKSKIQNPKSKMISVFGSCGGGRDRWKRPVLGQIAAKYCDQIILTNEDPYDENPSQILSDIKSGISNDQFLISNLHEVIDRREAINKALSLAQPGDTVIITGKGCEPTMCLANGKQVPWDDRQVVREEFEKLKRLEI
jgi:UDP-N-acetylmuramoyl-L-alanyl-D-glutamate--2,6-diaminopimelate ligase